MHSQKSCQSNLSQRSSLLKNKGLHPDRYCLSNFLPYDPQKKVGSALRNGLNEYFFLLYGALKAVEALELNDLEQFDALVGENACQIRAVWISIIASKKDIFLGKLKNNIDESKNDVCKLLEEKTIQKLMSSGVSLKELFINEKLFVSLSAQEAFVIQCFFLREVKSSNCIEILLDGILIKEKCIPKRLKKFGNVSSSFADNLVSKLRKTTAKQSVQFIRKYAEKSKDKKLIKMLADEFIVNHNNHLLCTPMFWTYKAVLFAAKIERIKIILHAKLLSNKGSCFDVLDEYWFDSGVEESELTIKRMDWDNLGNVPCVVFQGVACSGDDAVLSRHEWESGLLRFPMHKIILAGAADHRQYPNEEDNNSLSQLLQDHELETFKSFAREEGFSFENPSRFFIQHVYATNAEILRLRTPSLVG